MNNVVRVCAVAATLMLASCQQVQMGNLGAKSPATGAVAGSNTTGESAELERCSQTLGTLAIHEDRYADWYHYLHRHGVQSAEPVLRLLVQQSGCFAVVERGRGLSNAMMERDFQSSGELRQGSNFGKGQMVSADYTLTPRLIFSDQNTGGLGGALGGVFGGSLGAAIGGNLNFKSAQGILTLVDNRSTVQVAAAEGSSRGMDFGGIAGLMGSSAGGVLGGYSKTPQGKVVVGAMMDAYNNMVIAVRNYSGQAAAGPGGHGTGGRLTVDGSDRAGTNVSFSKPDKATVKEAQMKLNQLGFDVGVPDGVIGAKTRKAVSSFQRMSNLTVTGSLDAATIAKLQSM